MKYLNPIYLKQTVDFFQRYGLKSVLNKIPEYMMTTRGYQAWRRSHTPTSEDLAAQRESSMHMKHRPLFSILVPTYNTDPQQLSQMAESVFAQTYDNWELCIADGSPKPSAVEKFFTSDESYLNAGSETTGQEKIKFSSIENQGIAGNTNAAMEMATGDYVVLLDHDDMLSPDALHELAKAINEDSTIDVLYSDEDMVSADGTFLHNPNFKPDFSLDLLRSCNYITHLYAVRRDLALSVGGFSSDCDGSQDYDFTLKTTENGRNVCHIPKILYHWRVHNNSVAADSNNKTYAYDSAVRALQHHYERCGVPAFVKKDAQPGFYLTDYAITGDPLVSVLMYHCSESLRKELEEESLRSLSPEIHNVSCTDGSVSSASSDSDLSDISSYQLEFPASLSECHGEYVLILRHLESITPDTIRLLLSNCMRPEIGIAAPRVLDAHGKVTESGLIYNADGNIISPFKGKDPVYPGYHCYAVCQHQVSLVGPYCFMTTMENLRRNWKKGYVSKGKTASADIEARMAEFCFRTQQDQKLITVVPRADAVLNTKAGKRPSCIDDNSPARSYILNRPTDPYYTPNFSQKHPYWF